MKYKTFNYKNNIENIAKFILDNDIISKNFRQDTNENLNDTNDSTNETLNDSTIENLNDSTNENLNDSTNENLNDSTNDSTNENLTENETDSNIDIDPVNPSDLKSIMKINYAYPDQNDPHFQDKLYSKREFYYHKIQPREILIDYKDIKKFRDNACGGNFRLRSQQSLLANFLNPNTPFRGLLIFHGTGTGKCVHPDTIIVVNNVKCKISDLWDNSAIFIDNDFGEWIDVINKKYIQSYDYISNRIEYNYISKLYREYFNGFLRKIYLKNGLFIVCSINHMFYKYKIGWTNFININDKLLINKINNEYMYESIIKIERFKYTGYIYDLEINTVHSYVANNIITHNTCSAIAIAETFKEQVRKYGTKIHILVSGPLIKENWKDELIKCTKETYLKDITNNSGYLNVQDKNREIKQAKLSTQQYYKVISYRSFYKKVLGQKIVDVKFNDIKNKKSFRKTASGDFERDISIDRIDALNNTLLIIDEVHNLTDNEYGNAVKTIIEKSVNLKIVLLTATPMINFADEIIELINYIRPLNDQILRENIFTSDRSHLMNFKKGGQRYLQNMCSGYISHFRGLNPLTFAEGIDVGKIPNELFFTKLYSCKMLDFQLETYYIAIDTKDDALDRQTQAVSNFCFPGLDNDKKKIIGYYGKAGLNYIRTQLKSSKQLLQKLINDKFFDGKLDSNEIIKDVSQTKSITGLIFKYENIKYFSIKYYNALTNINNLVQGKKGASTAFVYFNLVKIGIEIFSEVLNVNGYTEYNENRNYNINDNTIDAITGLSFKEFIKDYKKEQFFPATYMTMTGKNEDVLEELPEIKKKIIDSVFNNISNKDGRYIKLILGSKVMNEGITLENVKEVHVMDVYYNLGKLHQVIGRAIRECKHYNITTDENPFPTVNIYRYVVSLDKNLSTEEIMYKKAEQKYLLVKETERLLKEVSFDCPLNYHGNIFPEETLKYKDCTEINKYMDMTVKERENVLLCPTQCDFRKCDFQCFDDKLNLKYYDSSTKLYKKITKDKLDFTTFTNELAKNEINYAKEKIKELFKFKYVYTLDECIYKIKSYYTDEKKKLFEDFFVFKALDDLIPLSENDFNNYSDIIYDKFNIPGYIIYRNKFYIFQPFEENEDIPMYYRATFHSNIFNDLSLHTYLKTTDILKLINTDVDTISPKKLKNTYDFKNVIEYYDNKPEFEYIGIIDKASGKKHAIDEIIPDTFKIRTKREKILIKKRGTGIPTLTGAVCETSNDKNELMKIALKINIKFDKSNKHIIESRTKLCLLIRNQLLFLEKYSTIKDKNKFTYIIIPSNHHNYIFPLNLEDRANYILKKINDKIPFKFEHKIDKQNNGIFEGKRDKILTKYILHIINNKEIPKYDNFLTNLGFKLKDDKWSIVIE